MEGDPGPPGLSGEPGKQGFRVSLFYSTYSQKQHLSDETLFAEDVRWHPDGLATCLLSIKDNSRSLARPRDISVCCTQCPFIFANS